MKNGKFHRSFNVAEDDDPDWLATYSDMMTDLLAIFVILFSFAMVNQAIVASKMSAGKESVIPLEGTQSIMPGKPDDESFNNLFESIKNYISEAGLSDKLSVTKEGEDQILLRVSVSVLFDSGRAEITHDAEPLLDKISEILTEYADPIKMVRIEGHTDNRPINTKLFDSNWELSTSRAVNVLRRIAETSVLGPEKFSAVGYGEFHPIADNDTSAGRAKNRRVDFIIESFSDSDK